MPQTSRITKRLSRHFSQEVCPWNAKFSQELAAGSPLAAREFIAGKDVRSLARELLALSQEDFSAAFKNSPITRTKLRGLQRNATVVLGNVESTDDSDVLTRALDDAEPLVCEHAEWSRSRVCSQVPQSPEP